MNLVAEDTPAILAFAAICNGRKPIIEFVSYVFTIASGPFGHILEHSRVCPHYEKREGDLSPTCLFSSYINPSVPVLKRTCVSSSPGVSPLNRLFKPWKIVLIFIYNLQSQLLQICVSVQESGLAKRDNFQFGVNAVLVDLSVVQSSVAVCEAILHRLSVP